MHSGMTRRSKNRNTLDRMILKRFLSGSFIPPLRFSSETNRISKYASIKMPRISVKNMYLLRILRSLIFGFKKYKTGKNMSLATY